MKQLPSLRTQTHNSTCNFVCLHVTKTSLVCVIWNHLAFYSKGNGIDALQVTNPEISCSCSPCTEVQCALLQVGDTISGQSLLLCPGQSVPARGHGHGPSSVSHTGLECAQPCEIYTVINGFSILNYSGDGLLGRGLREQGIEEESIFTVKGRIGTRKFIHENSDPLLNFLKA